MKKLLPVLVYIVYLYCVLTYIVLTVLHSVFIVFGLSSASVSLSCYFSLTVPMRKCSGEHSCMSSTFSIAIVNRTGGSVKMSFSSGSGECC